jgi:hypothetical protein
MEDSVVYIVSIAQVPIGDRAQKKPANLLLQKPESEEKEKRNGKSSTVTPARKAWLFQSNPVLYDLRSALRSRSEQVWSVSRYAKEIKTGDRVYLWEAGRKGGIAGVAEITEPARMLPEPPEQLPFARVAEVFAGDRLRARLKVLRVIEPVIPRQSIVVSPQLHALGVLRCSRGTNFRLSLDQWQALNDLILGGDGTAA